MPVAWGEPRKPLRGTWELNQDDQALCDSFLHRCCGIFPSLHVLSPFEARLINKDIMEGSRLDGVLRFYSHFRKAKVHRLNFQVSGT